MIEKLDYTGQINEIIETVNKLTAELRHLNAQYSARVAQCNGLLDANDKLLDERDALRAKVDDLDKSEAPEPEYVKLAFWCEDVSHQGIPGQTMPGPLAIYREQLQRIAFLLRRLAEYEKRGA